MKNIVVLLLVVVPCLAMGNDELKVIEGQNVVGPHVSGISACNPPTEGAPDNPTVTSYFGNLFITDFWPARWTCGQWSSFEGWFYIASDFTIFLAYMLIPLVLLWYVRQKDYATPLVRKVLIMFIVFILLCGFTHFIDVVLFWFPVYRLSGFVKAFTGVVSLGTVATLVIVTPKFLEYKSPGQVARQELESLQYMNVLLDEQVRLKTEELTRQKEDYELQANKLQLALGVGKIGIWDWNLQTDYVKWDDNMLKIFDYDQSEFKNNYEGFVNRLHKDDRDRVLEDIKTSIEAGEIFDSEFRLVIKDGSLKHVTAMATILHDKKGKPWKMIGTNQDITSLKSTQHKLRELNMELETKVEERSEELNEKVRLLEAANDDLRSFSYSISHDLRAPLRALSGFSDALYDNYHDLLDEKGRRWVTFIKKNSGRMDELIEDILTLSRTTQSPICKSIFDMNQTVNEIFEENRSDFPETKFQLKMNDLKKVEADEGLIRQLWYNLISNAMKYSSKNKKSQIFITCNETDRQIIYKIKDDGVGFDAKYKDKLFMLFQRLHNDSEFEGTGIGLTIAKKIVNRHGGDIWAESELGRGATFYFSIPKS